MRFPRRLQLNTLLQVAYLRILKSSSARHMHGLHPHAITRSAIPPAIHPSMDQLHRLSQTSGAMPVQPKYRRLPCIRISNRTTQTRRPTTSLPSISSAPSPSPHLLAARPSSLLRRPILRSRPRHRRLQWLSSSTASPFPRLRQASLSSLGQRPNFLQQNQHHLCIRRRPSTLPNYHQPPHLSVSTMARSPSVLRLGLPKASPLLRAKQHRQPNNRNSLQQATQHLQPNRSA